MFRNRAEETHALIEVCEKRFYLKQLNPQALSQDWLAEMSISWLKEKGFDQLYDQAYLIFVQAKEAYAHFLQTQDLTDELIKSSLLLAKLDAFYRVGKIDKKL